MMVAFEKKRRHPRKEIYIPTKFKKADSDIYSEGRIRNISFSGICLESETVLEKGDLVEFIVDDESYEERYLATAEVRWVGSSRIDQ